MSLKKGNNILFQILQANPSDITLLSILVRKSYQDVALRFSLTLKNAPTHPSNCTDDWIKSDFEKGKLYYILRENMKACGCVAIEKVNDKIYYLGRLGVLHEHRKNGYGTALVDYVKNEAKKSGGETIQIGIIGENSELKEWYQKCGFIFKENLHFDHLPFTVCIMYFNLN